ncbi:MAG: fumarate/nitrate reduction transcriptional regulator Fnr [Thiohalomonadaceae bacterium]
MCESLLFSGLTGTQVCRMHGVIHKKAYAPKAVLFREGTPTNHLYLLKSGYVKLTTALPDGRNQGLRLGAAWQFIGLEAMSDQRYPYTAEAVTPIEVCMVRYKDMLKLLEANPQLSLRVINALNRELQRSNAMIRNLGMMSSTERVASFLLSLLRAEAEEVHEIPLPLSRTDMAEMLGLTLETVSRVLSRMTRDKIIWVQPGGRLLRIIDAARLKQLGGDAMQESWPRAVRA